MNKSIQKFINQFQVINSPTPPQVVLPTTERVFVSMPFAGLRAMQVCVVADATDEEILECCNRENPQMVSGGWHTVIRTLDDAKKHGVDETAVPGNCVECAGRVHMIVICM